MFTTTKSSLVAVLAAGFILALAPVAQAAITTVGLYHMGEDGDDLSVALEAAVGTDAGTVTLGSATIVTGEIGAPSASYVNIPTRSPGARWSAPTYLTGATTNWGMDAWLKLPAGPGPITNYMAVSNGQFYQMLSIWDSNPMGWIITGNYAEVTEWGTWVHAALVYNGTGNREFYLNGIQVGAGQNFNSNNPVEAAGGTHAFWIGTGNSNTGGEWVGGIDEVRVFSFAEGEFDISDVFSQQAAVPEPSTFVLAGFGLMGLGFFAWKKRRNA